MRYDVVGIGAALLDIVVEVSDEILDTFDLEKGTMHLVSSEENKYILEHLNTYKKHLSSGGSVANSTVNLVSLGDIAGFIGSVGNDNFGKQFIQNIQTVGVDPFIQTTQNTTGHAITMVTPDGERTFATHIGAAHNIQLDEKQKEVIKNSSVLYIEGYLLDGDATCKTVFECADIAKENKKGIAVDMSNVSIVRQHHTVLRKLIREYATIVFANEDEARAYTGKDAKEAVNILAQECDIAVVTQSEKGSLIRSEDITHEVSSVKPEKIVNTNGAGDTYAAGILHGIVNELPLEKAGEIASFFASAAVSHHEARLPQAYVKKEYHKHFKD